MTEGVWGESITLQNSNDVQGDIDHLKALFEEYKCLGTSITFKPLGNITNNMSDTTSYAVMYCAGPDYTDSNASGLTFDLVANRGQVKVRRGDTGLHFKFKPHVLINTIDESGAVYSAITSPPKWIHSSNTNIEHNGIKFASRWATASSSTAPADGFVWKVGVWMRTTWLFRRKL